MFKKILFLLILPNLSFATSCRLEQTELSFSLISEKHEIIAFKVLGVNQYSANSVDVEVTHKLSESSINSNFITISRGELSVSYPLISGFTEGSEWVSAIATTDNYYHFYTCVQALQIKNGIVKGITGLNSLDNLTTGFSIEQLNLALKSYQQGLQNVNYVCQSNNSYCNKVKATYDKHTGILNLPSVEFKVLGYPAYLNAKMQLNNDESDNFTVIELQGYSDY